MMTMLIDYLDIIMFAALMICILSGFPVSFSIAGVAIVFAYLGWALGVMNINLLGALAQRVFGVMTNTVLIAIPLFVLMGVVLERSRIAESLLDTMGRLFGQLRGGLGISVIIVGALLAASTGIVGATVIAMGMIALPTMLRTGYNPKLASGLVCTAGTLGQIIPPSTLLIILSDVMSSAYQQAQYEQGKFTVETISVGQLFSGALLPGLLLVGLYILYVLARGLIFPNDMPPAEPLSAEEKPSWRETISAVLPPMALIIAVLGSILGGVATPTEAASVGAVGAILLAGMRQAKLNAIGTINLRELVMPGVLFVLIYLGINAGILRIPEAMLVGMLALSAYVLFTKINATLWISLGALSLVSVIVLSGLDILTIRLTDTDSLHQVSLLDMLQITLTILGFVGILLSLRLMASSKMLGSAVGSTMTVSAMIFATIITASVFSLVFVGLGGEDHIAELLQSMPGGALGALLFCMILIFVLGFFLDFVEITVILLPLIAPVLIMMGHDPIWLGILIAINLQTSFLTPPFGFSLFYLRGAAPPEITTGQIYAGVVPFIVIQIIGMTLIAFLPIIATWLPDQMFG